MKVGGVLLLSLFCFSCEQFSGEFVSEEYVLVETIKYKDHCKTTLYVDGKYTTQVTSSNCRFYIKTVTAEN
jgi:hypothetical protein